MKKRVEQVQMFLSPVALSVLQAWLCVHPPAAVEEEEKQQNGGSQNTGVTHPGVRLSTLKQMQQDGSQYTGVTHPGVSTLKLSPSATGRYWQLLVAAPEKAV
mgnify:CR=1 FL=1